MTGVKRVALYTRVSTDGQTVENQQRELHAVADRRGWQIVAEYSDPGISGSKGRDKRPGFDKLLKGATRGDYDMIAAWSVDRLGRSLQHLVEFLGEINAAGVDLYLHQQALDTSTPTGRMLFQLLGVFAEFERSMIVARVKSGLARAVAKGVKLGRRPVGAAIEGRIMGALADGQSVSAAARAAGVSRGTVRNVQERRAAAD